MTKDLIELEQWFADRGYSRNQIKMMFDRLLELIDQLKIERIKSD